MPNSAKQRLTYNDLNNSDLFLSVLVNQLSYPKQNTGVHWQEWRRHPIQPQILDIAKTLSKHRMHSLRLQREQDNILDQAYQLQFELITPEDFQRAQEYLQKTHAQLLTAERDEIKQQIDYLEAKQTAISESLSQEDDNKAFERLFLKQLKLLEKQLKQGKHHAVLEQINQLFKAKKHKATLDLHQAKDDIYKCLIVNDLSKLAEDFIAPFAQDDTEGGWKMDELYHLIDIAIPNLINASQARLAEILAKMSDIKAHGLDYHLQSQQTTASALDTPDTSTQTLPSPKS